MHGALFTNKHLHVSQHESDEAVTVCVILCEIKEAALIGQIKGMIRDLSIESVASAKYSEIYQSTPEKIFSNV